MTEARDERRRLSLLLLVVGAHQRMVQLVDRELAVEGVQAADYALLSLVGVRGPVRPTSVAEELGLPLTTASDAIRRLERRGHVERLGNPADGRSSLVQLTAEGDAEWRRGWPALRRIEGMLAARLVDAGAARAALEELREVFGRALTTADGDPIT